MEKLSEQEIIRREKLQKYRDLGIDPFGQRYEVTHKSAPIKAQYKDYTHEELEEMKVTLNARVPYAILAEDDVICTAPIDMLQSGYGDIVGKYSCLNDWKLAHLLRNEYTLKILFNSR